MECRIAVTRRPVFDTAGRSSTILMRSSCKDIPARAPHFPDSLFQSANAYFPFLTDKVSRASPWGVRSAGDRMFVTIHIIHSKAFPRIDCLSSRSAAHGGAFGFFDLAANYGWA